MSERMRRGQYAKSAAVRCRILDAARQLLEQRSAAHVSLRAIAQAAGMSQAGLLHHFPSKAALLAAAASTAPAERSPELDRLGEADEHWAAHRERIESWLRLTRHSVAVDTSVRRALETGYRELIAALPRLEHAETRDRLAHLIGLQLLNEIESAADAPNTSTN